MIDLEPIKKRIAAATSGPWWVALNGYGDLTIHYGDPDDDSETYDLFEHYERPDYELMAHARVDMPALVAEVERLRQVETAAREYRNAMEDHSGLDFHTYAELVAVAESKLDALLETQGNA